ncbi:hypothetical protein DYB35_006586 [Aphanomyces astaci]|uniref:Tubulin/FtsZ GTPase domain-containing protein n=1 Tax=Aphanomyces astaci TaxID=112090 RepID=A0A3R6XR55_APHAT|nr:hypothetical protein DYB35_006586 [Aphanomyces astaci]
MLYKFPYRKIVGNNWAYGYAVHGTACHEAVLDVVRKEVERCDYFKGFLALQSLAGGTGSGLGTIGWIPTASLGLVWMPQVILRSFVCDSLRELYPTSYLLNTVVWPYRSGEVIVQNYNTLLTMACLSESSDGVLIVENDLADQICRRLLAIPTPSFHQMNQVLTNHIAAMLMPALPFQVLLYLCVCTYASYVSNWRSNSQAILPQVESMLDKAHRMFTSNAYVHQYATHGVDADFFQSCFLRLDQMVVNYKSM